MKLNGKTNRFKLFGTWKNRLTLKESKELAHTLFEHFHNTPEPFEVSICPPMIALASVAEILRSEIPLTAQNLVWDAPNSFTGETSAKSLVELGCTFVMVGHSERRLYLGEDDAIVAKKVDTAICHGLTPLICLGELYEDFVGNRTELVLTRQITNLAPVLRKWENPAKVLIAYEPAWAITTSAQALPCDPPLAQKTHVLIRHLLNQLCGDRYGDAVTMIYGAGVTPDNIEELCRQPDIDGGLAGGASQKWDSFEKLLTSIRHALKAGQIQP